MSYIAPISHEERLKLEGASEVVEQPVEAPAEEVVAEEAPKKKSTKKSAE